MIFSGATAVAAALIVTGCTSAGVGPGLSTVGTPGPEYVQGRAAVVGSRPFARTVIEPVDGTAVSISGPFDTEIGRLAGAQVRVTGSYLGDGTSGPSLSASSYEILSVDGDPVVIGVLARIETGHVLRTRHGERSVGAVSVALSEHVGSLVWVVLDENHGAARYGVLRPAAR